MQEVDSGFTHVAFMVRDLQKSIDFYTRYTAMQVIHRRSPDLPSARHVAWLSDRTRPFPRPGPTIRQIFLTKLIR